MISSVSSVSLVDSRIYEECEVHLAKVGLVGLW